MMITPSGESPSRPGRRRQVVLAGVGAAILLGIGAVVVISNDSEPSVASGESDAVESTEPAEDEKELASTDLPPKTIDGVVAAGRWTIVQTADGTSVRGSVDFTNDLTETILLTWDELIPKQLVAAADSVVSTPRPTSTIEADPELRYCLTIQPGEDAALFWTAPLASTSMSQDVLSSLAKAWSTDFDNHDRTVGAPCTPATSSDPVASSTTTTKPSGGGGGGAPTPTSGSSSSTAKPQNIVATALSSSSVRVTFSLSSSIPGTTCQLVVKKASVVVATISNGCTEGTFVGLTPSTTYVVLVRAIGPSSAFVEEASSDPVTTKSPNAVPVAVKERLSFTFATGDPIRKQKCATINILVNDYDPDGGALTAEVLGVLNFTPSPPNGSYYTLSADGTFTMCVHRGVLAGANGASDFILTTLEVFYKVKDDEGLYSTRTWVEVAVSRT